MSKTIDSKVVNCNAYKLKEGLAASVQFENKGNAIVMKQTHRETFIRSYYAGLGLSYTC